MVNGVAHSHKAAKTLGRVVLVVRKSIIACLPHSAALMHSVEYQFFIILAFNKGCRRLGASGAWAFSVFASYYSNARGALHRTKPIADTRLRLIIQALFSVQ